MNQFKRNLTFKPPHSVAGNRTQYAPLRTISEDAEKMAPQPSPSSRGRPLAVSEAAATSYGRRRSSLQTLTQRTAEIETTTDGRVVRQTTRNYCYLGGGCPGCPRWKIDQRGRQYGQQRASECGIWGVSTLSGLFEYLSRTRGRVCDARLTYDSSRITPDSVDTRVLIADIGGMQPSTSGEGVHGGKKSSVDTPDTPGGGYCA